MTSIRRIIRPRVPVLIATDLSRRARGRRTLRPSTKIVLVPERGGAPARVTAELVWARPWHVLHYLLMCTPAVLVETFEYLKDRPVLIRKEYQHMVRGIGCAQPAFQQKLIGMLWLQDALQGSWRIIQRVRHHVPWMKIGRIP